MAVRAVKDKLKTSKSLPQVLSSCTLCNLVLGTEIGTRYRYIDDTPLVPLSEAATGGSSSVAAGGAKTRSRSNNEYVLYSYGEPVAMSADGNANYFGTDILGSVRNVTDKYGAVQSSYDYDAFGSPYLGNLENDIGFGYCGKVYDIGTGLYDYGFRDYSPNNARFTTIDPIRDGSNWFSYVVNDPVNYVDPFGLKTCQSASDAENGFKVNFKGSPNSDPNNNFKDNFTGVDFNSSTQKFFDNQLKSDSNNNPKITFSRNVFANPYMYYESPKIDTRSQSHTTGTVPNFNLNNLINENSIGFVGDIANKVGISTFLSSETLKNISMFDKQAKFLGRVSTATNLVSVFIDVMKLHENQNISNQLDFLFDVAGFFPGTNIASLAYSMGGKEILWNFAYESAEKACTINSFIEDWYIEQLLDYYEIFGVK
ncbi:MAG: RHS repeat-associated core domain-containing protein [Treponema sp.]|nr:RHS repeat-associated core domain-containing protein [Treponema sp.]